MIKIGSLYQSTQCGLVKVIQKGTRPNCHIVQFANTGTIKEFRDYTIVNGCIRDPYARLVCGVACTGNLKTKGKYKPYYSIWHDMINRCYNPKNKRYNPNVTVINDWLVFENFYHDCKNIEGFNAKLIESGELVLDKDAKQRFQPTKVYSADTCKWISKAENVAMQDRQQKPFIAIAPDGTQFEDFNITRFAYEHNLIRRHVSSALHKRITSTGGWKFYYKEIV